MIRPAAHVSASSEARLRSPWWRDHDLVFPNCVGNQTGHNNLYQRGYKPLLTRAGLADEGFTFHSLRHTFVTALFKRVLHPEKVQQALLGHSSITQTMDAYSHLLNNIGGDVMGSLDEAVGDTGTT
jgi:integrase